MFKVCPASGLPPSRMGLKSLCSPEIHSFLKSIKTSPFTSVVLKKLHGFTTYPYILIRYWKRAICLAYDGSRSSYRTQK